MRIAIVVLMVVVMLGCKAIDLPDLPDVIPTPLPTPLPTTTTTTIPPASVEATEQAQGFSHPAPITARITLVKIDSNNIYWTGDKMNWGSGELVGESHAGVLRDGKWVSAKYDHVRADTTSRDFKNIHNGYQGWVEPKQGETVAFFCISYDKTKRTNAIFAEWK